ncbi:putative iron-sulfur cluster assembly accessory protein [Dipodascopsis tothii]|uniref:putative iron-sulfur cluster assembly accessory protein n=1 Tax=Dipodascopsis tothii TaxID=44089 RepID=UPI0034CF27E0
MLRLHSCSATVLRSACSAGARSAALGSRRGFASGLTAGRLFRSTPASGPSGLTNIARARQTRWSVRNVSASAVRITEIDEAALLIDPAQQKTINPKLDDEGREMQIHITARAAAKLKSIMDLDKNPNLLLRILVESGGCHGFQYSMGLKEDFDPEEDTIFELGGARVAIDESSLEILKDSKVDYTTELIGSQFAIVENPRATSSCGCGNSFDIDFDKKI